MTSRLRIGINGFGRIGRMVLRAAMTRDDIEVVAINDLLPIEHLAYLLKYDSVHGAFGHDVAAGADALDVAGRAIAAFREKDPAAIGGGDTGADIVIESTGRFLTSAEAEAHLRGGAGKVVLSAPPKDGTPVFVMGVNESAYAGERIVSNASCTTNCVAPLTKLLNDAYGVDEALMITVHAVTAGQNTVDGVAAKDWRFGRGVFGNIIPATTGAARMVGKVIPELNGRINGMSVRVPVADVSMVDLTLKLRKKASYDEISALVKEAATNGPKGVFDYVDEPVVSTDLRGNAHSTIYDALAGMQTGDGLTKLIAWYDNEWGYANRCLDLAAHIAA